MNILVVCLYIVSLYAAYIAGVLHLRAETGESTSKAKLFPQVTLFLTAFIALTATLQFLFPILLQIFERDYTRFLAGEWWRMVTPLFFQDGGISGSVFNLVTLFLVGMVAEKIWGGRRWLIIFFVGGILSELVGFVWQPIGAGNSVANFSLAASVTIFCLFRTSLHPARIAALISLGADLVLFFMKDIHGAAAMLGALIALLLLRLS